MIESTVIPQSRSCVINDDINKHAQIFPINSMKNLQYLMIQYIEVFNSDFGCRE